MGSSLKAPSRLRKNSRSAQGSRLKARGQDHALDGDLVCSSSLQPRAWSLLRVFQHPASAVLLAFGVAALAWAQDLTFSATVDKTTVALGDSLKLTVTLSGDVSDVKLPPLQFPEGFSIAARSQSTNFSLHAGAMERSLSLVYVLISQRIGTFQLGPFKLEHHRKEFQTEPIEIIVKPSAGPPQPEPHGERFIL